MENASKALLMAAGVLIAILVVALVVYAFNNMSNTMQNDLTAQQEKQLAEFNTEFASYDRDGLTGFDMISLVNKVIDYNILNAQEQGYPRVDVEFSLNDRSASILKINKTYKTDSISDKDFLSGNVDSGLFDEDIGQLEQRYGKNELTKLVRKKYGNRKYRNRNIPKIY